jgi:formylglycine-generating enzyme required for sulfatase activity
MNKRQWLLWCGIMLGMALLILGLTSFTPAESITRSDCEADSEFIFIPAGEFIAGSDRQERDYGYQISAAALASSPEQRESLEQRLKQQAWFEQESPRQLSALPDFCIRRNLISNADYQEFVQATGHPAPGISAAEYQQQGFLVHPYSDVHSYLWQANRYPVGVGQHPVVLVSYEDALAFARWKGQQDQQTYRLPTTAEWEKAARGTDGRYFPWGNQWQDTATNWAKSRLAGTSAIASFPLSRSIYGVEDMAGNLFEYSSTLRSQNGQTISVMKGCAWDDAPGFCRAAYQHNRPIQSRHILFGFRLVRELG